MSAIAVAMASPWCMSGDEESLRAWRSLHIFVPRSAKRAAGLGRRGRPIREVGD